MAIAWEGAGLGLLMVFFWLDMDSSTRDMQRRELMGLDSVLFFWEGEGKRDMAVMC